jgi:integrase
MAVRKIGKSWRVDFWFNGQRYRIKGPENSRTGAHAYEAVLRQKLARGESIDKELSTQDEPTFEQFAWKWYDEYVVSNNKYSEQRTKKYLLGATIVPFFGKIPVGQITTHHIEQYKALQIKRGVTNKTLRNRLTVLNKCLATAYEWLDLDGAPPKIKWPKCAPNKTDYLSPEECELLLQNSDGVVYEMILMALRTGMRQGELRGLQWSSIDWQNQSLAVRHSRCDYQKELVSPKSNKERYIPLDIDLYEMLYKRKKHSGYVFADEDRQPFDGERLIHRLAKVCEKAGLRKITWHILRHTFATHLAGKSVPLHAVQALLGHSNIITTMRYAHVAPSALRTAIDLLNPKTMVKDNFGHYLGTEWAEAQQKEISEKSVVLKNP